MSSEELADTIAAVNAKIDAQIAQSRQLAQEPVSYTHLTLPTIYSV